MNSMHFALIMTQLTMGWDGALNFAKSVVAGDSMSARLTTGE
jgi:hypothetical protein